IDERNGVWRLSKMLPQGMSFPCDFGFVPSTRGDDGDPIDVLVLMDEAAFLGAVVPARLIGVLEPAQTNGHSTPNRPRFGRRFWSQVHVTPAYQKALDWGPERPLVQWSEGMTARSAVQPGLYAFRKT